MSSPSAFRPTAARSSPRARTALRTSGTLPPAKGSCSSSGVPAPWAPSTPPPSARTEDEIATASANRLGTIYYSQDGRVIASLAGHHKAVTSIEFDPSGRTIVTGSSDGTARLWGALPEGTLQNGRHRASCLCRRSGQATGSSAVAGNRVKILSTSGHVLTRFQMTGAMGFGGRQARRCGRGSDDPGPEPHPPARAKPRASSKESAPSPSSTTGRSWPGRRTASSAGGVHAGRDR